jgi:hypothetical protein
MPHASTVFFSTLLATTGHDKDQIRRRLAISNGLLQRPDQRAEFVDVVFHAPD